MARKISTISLLHTGETILWEGCPAEAPLNHSDLIRISVILAGMHLALIALVSAGGNMTWPMALGFLACYLLLDGVTILMSVLDTRNHQRNDHYRITDRRVLLLVPGGNAGELTASDAVSIAEIIDLTRLPGHDGLASILLTTHHRRSSLTLLNLPDADSVMELIYRQPCFTGQITIK